MGDISQSSATTTNTAPEYYTNYISNLAQQSTAAKPTYVGAQPQQEQAWNLAGANVGNYQPGLNAANALINQGANVDIMGAANPYLQAGTSSAADLTSGYMNPYTSNVVDKIRMANQQNIAQNLSPGITAGAVGSGQFGSQRGANALALGISNANIGALGQQAAALQSGYSDALKAAQAQRANQLTAGQTAGNMATQQAQSYRDLAIQRMKAAQQQQEQGLTDANALATYGAQKQQIEQNRELFPLDVLNKKASILSGVQVPMTTTQTMNASDLSTLAGIASLGAAAFANGPSTQEPVLGADGKPTYDALGRPIMKTVPGASYVDRFLNWINGGKVGAAPALPTSSYGNTGGSNQTGGQPGGSVNNTAPNVIADGSGGWIDTATNLPVNQDGTPISNRGDNGVVADNTSPTGYVNRYGNPVNADGTPYIDIGGGGGSGSNSGGGDGGYSKGHYETQYDENNDPIEVWVPD